MHDHSDRETPARQRRRRRPHLAGLVGALALTLAVAACGGGKSNGVASLSGSDKPTATTSANTSKDFKQAALAFARCMRQHGINVPDPNPNGGGIVVKGGPGTLNPDDPKFKAAQQACQKLLPNAGKGGTLTNSGGGK
jgi:hypothetical protein